MNTWHMKVTNRFKHYRRTRKPGFRSFFKQKDNRAYRHATKKKMHYAYVNDAWDDFVEPDWDYIACPWTWLLYWW